MKFKVLAVSTSEIDVEYADGSRATVVIEKGMDKNAILNHVRDFNKYTRTTSFDKVGDVPFKVNDEDDTDNAPSHNHEAAALKLTYKQIREHYYPSIGNQMDAAYKARKGDDTEQKAIDVLIADVKTKYPKDAKVYTEDDLK